MIRQVPEPYASACNKAAKIDRQYFAEHPSETDYVRKAIEHESYPKPTFKHLFTHVVKIGKGKRLRIPMPHRTAFFESVASKGMTLQEYARQYLISGSGGELEEPGKN